MNICSLIIIATTTLTSIAGFNNRSIFDRYKFNVGYIVGQSKQRERLITSAFLHGDYMHLIFNMFTLYIFSDIVVYSFGYLDYLLIYFGAIIGGGLLSLWMHKNEPNYSAIGASGGVVGILFSSIAIDPHISLYLFFIPIPIEGWIFAIAYLGLSIYGMITQRDNVGHDAHFGGALVGLLLTLLIAPQLLFKHTLYVLAIMIPIFIMGYYVWKKKRK